MMLLYFPDLKKKLLLAESKYEAVEFLEKVMFSTLFLSLGLLVVTGLYLLQVNISLVYLIPLAIAYPVLILFYLMLYPDAAVIKRQRSIDYEVLFAGRHLLIGLRSGMPLFDSMAGITFGYGDVSIEFNKIVEKVTLGVPITQAIHEVAENNPSKYFVRISMQIANSLASGADVANSLEVVLDQISKEQLIALKEYGQKLTPAVMFFMIFGIILPSIGVVLATVMFSVISGGAKGLTSAHLIMVFVVIAVVQFLFLGIIETSRPKYLI